jgi:glutaredoxin
MKTSCGKCKKSKSKAEERQKEHELAVWMDQQIEDYKNNTGEMRNPAIRKNGKNL